MPVCNPDQRERTEVSGRRCHTLVALIRAVYLRARRGIPRHSPNLRSVPETVRARLP